MTDNPLSDSAQAAVITDAIMARSVTPPRNLWEWQVVASWLKEPVKGVILAGDMDHALAGVRRIIAAKAGEAARLAASTPAGANGSPLAVGASADAEVVALALRARDVEEAPL
jgi:hypothetical protein